MPDIGARWQDWAQAGALAPLFAELVALHYDPLYARSQSTHLHQWATRRTLASEDLSAAGIDALAAQVLGLDEASNQAIPCTASQ